MADMTGDDAATLLADAIAAKCDAGSPPLIGLNGAQGSGKSTMAAKTAEILEARGIRIALLSLDDFYLPRSSRLELAQSTHVLCATRGVPGTHDVPLMRRVIEMLQMAGPDDVTRLPAFDKLSDDRLPREEWGRFRGTPDVLLLEGWCVGLHSADLPPWSGPINSLEMEKDLDGAWCTWSRIAMEREYDPLWAQFALLASIEVPDLDAVIESRLRQEEGLAADTGREGMDRAAITRFVEHYERHTRALWASMPDRADLLFRRDADYRYTLVKGAGESE